MQSQTPENSRYSKIRVYVDAHVHIHHCFDIQKFFDIAAENFRCQASKSATATTSKYVLCLTETFGTNMFNRLAEWGRDSESVGERWEFSRAGARESILASHPSLGRMEIVAGRQIVTAERLEILGLGLVGDPPDGQPIVDIVNLVLDSGAIPVLPWGFGKWLGVRGHVVRDLIEKFHDKVLYLGDNSGRPELLRDPAEFARARHLGMRILPGSDPLPFSSEYNKAGSFGFYVDVFADVEDVWTGLRTMLQKGEGNLQNYGSLESPFRFVRNQVAMQYLTRVANRAKAS